MIENDRERDGVLVRNRLGLWLVVFLGAGVLTAIVPYWVYRYGSDEEASRTSDETRRQRLLLNDQVRLELSTLQGRVNALHLDLLKLEALVTALQQKLAETDGRHMPESPSVMEDRTGSERAMAIAVSRALLLRGQARLRAVIEKSLESNKEVSRDLEAHPPQDQDAAQFLRSRLDDRKRQLEEGLNELDSVQDEDQLESLRRRLESVLDK